MIIPSSLDDFPLTPTQKGVVEGFVTAFRSSLTSNDPEHAARLANTISFEDKAIVFHTWSRLISESIDNIPAAKFYHRALATVILKAAGYT
jgi:hypothetical protein